MSCGPEDCRYGLFDFEYQHQCQGTSEKTMKEKLLLMSWCPDTARIKKKMLYSSSFHALKKCLVGVQKYIQVSQMSNQKKSSILNNDHILGHWWIWSFCWTSRRKASRHRSCVRDSGAIGNQCGEISILIPKWANFFVIFWMEPTIN